MHEVGSNDESMQASIALKGWYFHGIFKRPGSNFSEFSENIYRP